MNAFFGQLADALADGPVALATVIAVRGSTPRTVGARQFLAADGRTVGTVGGGAMEARALESMAATLIDGQTREFVADLLGRPGDVRDGICGGTMTIGVERLDDASEARRVAEALAAGRRAGFRGEAITPDPFLLIVGAGHIGKALATLMTGLGFVVRVQDERPEWREAIGEVGDAELSASRARLVAWEGPRFVALVSRGYAQDVAALAALADVPELRYLGVLGSRPRWATVRTACRDAGVALPEAVLHAPIGIDIGAETPEEIAVSIAAEIIRVRRRNEA